MCSRSNPNDLKEGYKKRCIISFGLCSSRVQGLRTREFTSKDDAPRPNPLLALALFSIYPVTVSIEYPHYSRVPRLQSPHRQNGGASSRRGGGRRGPGSAVCAAESGADCRTAGIARWPSRRCLPASHFLCTLAREPAATAARLLLNR